MPNIREFTNPVPGVRPSGAGPAAFAQIAGVRQQEARHTAGVISEVANQAGRAVQTHVDAQDKAAAQKEIMEGSAALSLMDENATSNYLEAIRGADPNDASVGSKWRQDYLEPQLESFLGSMKTEGGRTWALSQVTSMRNQYFRTTTADAINRAGIATAANADLSINSSAQGAYNNPDTLPDIMDRLNTTINALAVNSAISPELAAAFTTKDWNAARKEVINGAILGMARKNPELLQKMLGEGGEWSKKYAAILGADGITAGLELADRMVKAKAEADRVARNDAYTEKQRASDSAKGQVLLDAFDPNKRTWTFDLETINKIMDDPTMTPADKQAAIENLKRLGGAVDADKDTYGLVSSLIARLSLPASDPNHLTNTELMSYVGSTGPKKLTQASFNFVKGLMDGDAGKKDFFSRHVTAALTAASVKINPTKGPLGDFLLGAGGQQAEAQMREDVFRRIQGMSDEEQQKALLDPASKSYLFTPEYIQGWRDKAKAYGPLGEGGGSNVGGGGGALRQFIPAPAGSTAKPPPAPATRPPLKLGVTPGQVDPASTGSIRNSSTAVERDPVKLAAAVQQDAILADWARENDVNPSVLKAALETPNGGMLAPETPNTKQTAPAATPGALKVITDQPERTVNAAGYGEKITGAVVVNGRTYKFVSGGGGRGSIPFGTYKVLDFMTGAERAKAGYQYKYDSFMLTDAKDPLIPGQAPRTGLLFHRARGSGTAGCIGIIGDESVFQQFIKDMNIEVAKSGGFGGFKISVGPESA